MSIEMKQIKANFTKPKMLVLKNYIDNIFINMYEIQKIIMQNNKK